MFVLTDNDFTNHKLRNTEEINPNKSKPIVIRELIDLKNPIQSISIDFVSSNPSTSNQDSSLVLDPKLKTSALVNSSRLHGVTTSKALKSATKLKALNNQDPLSALEDQRSNLSDFTESSKFGQRQAQRRAQSLDLREQKLKSASVSTLKSKQAKQNLAYKNADIFADQNNEEPQHSFKYAKRSFEQTNTKNIELKKIDRANENNSNAVVSNSVISNVLALKSSALNADSDLRANPSIYNKVLAQVKNYEQNAQDDNTSHLKEECQLNSLTKIASLIEQKTDKSDYVVAIDDTSFKLCHLLHKYDLYKKLPEDFLQPHEFSTLKREGLYQSLNDGDFKEQLPESKNQETNSSLNQTVLLSGSTNGHFKYEQTAAHLFEDRLAHNDKAYKLKSDFNHLSKAKFGLNLISNKEHSIKSKTLAYTQGSQDQDFLVNRMLSNSLLEQDKSEQSKDYKFEQDLKHLSEQVNLSWLKTAKEQSQKAESFKLNQVPELTDKLPFQAVSTLKQSKLLPKSASKVKSAKAKISSAEQSLEFNPTLKTNINKNQAWYVYLSKTNPLLPSIYNYVCKFNHNCQLTSTLRNKLTKGCYESFAWARLGYGNQVKVCFEHQHLHLNDVLVLSTNYWYQSY